jgi:glycosyltransferase involved in cell wall biosynthesis
MIPKKILSLTKYGYAGPSSRYRFYNYQECFESKGYEVKISPFFNDNYFKEKSSIAKIQYVLLAYLYRIGLLLSLVLMPKRFDIILVEYELIPYFPSLFEYCLHKRGYKYIVDYDDPLFHRYDMHSNNFIRFVLKNKISKVMFYADTVIVCNSYLYNYAIQHNVNIIMMPTVVKSIDTYISTTSMYSKDSSNHIIIGWIGSKSTSKFILDILPAITKVTHDKVVEFRLIGFDGSLLNREQIESCNIKIVPWSEENEILEIAKIDIGIMPLKYNPWTRGKCGFKLVQYMSCAKAVIASPVGVNKDIVSSENGILANSIEDWINGFEKLVNDKTMRDRLGNKGLDKVKKRYNYSNNCKKYIHLIESLIG